MTKELEISLLSDLVSRFPSDSYVGTWLRTVQPEIVRDIKSDIFPSASPSDIYRENIKAFEDARRKCAILIEDAQRQASKIVEDAHVKASAVMMRADAERNAAIAAASKFIKSIS